MKILVVYYSETGNTAKIAGAIHKVASYRGHTVCLRPIGDVTVDALSTYDLVFLGSACHDADLARPVMQLMEQIPDSPGFKLAGFVTHASYTPEGGDREGQLHERWAARCAFSFGKTCQKKGIDLLGYYGCMGAPSPPIEQFIHNTILTEAEEWKRYLEEVRRHPDQEDLQQAGEFAEQVLARCEA